MAKPKTDPESLLPLTPAVFHILLSLAGGDRHGYAIMQDVAESTEGQIKLGPGTLYGTVKRLLEAQLIEESDERPDAHLDDERRRYYRLTGVGERVVRAEAQRYADIVAIARGKKLIGKTALQLACGRCGVNIESRRQKFPVSEKTYGALLRAYPAAHRAAYGGMMAQLFRDQCRDAWDESKNFGLLKLWLRVLPDLVSTSIMERLAALNERKTMSDKLGNLATFGASPGKAFTRTFVVVFLLTVITSVAVTFILPEIYASTVSLKIEQTGQGKYDPYFHQTQYEIMVSETVLLPVIEKLDLNKVWGKKYFGGESLNTADTYKILKARLEFKPVHGTKMDSITAYSDNRLEAAQLANAVAESYRDYRVKAYTDDTNLTKDPAFPLQALADIVDLAEPGKVPVKPNKPLNITLGVVFGFLLAGVVGGAAFFITKLRQRNRAPGAPA